MKWFGPPWPSSQRRAPVCEDDANRVELPIGEGCISCGTPFVEGDRGVSLPWVSGNVFVLDAYYHAQCFLAEVVGKKMASEVAGWWTRT